jgi:hypothetical protein
MENEDYKSKLLSTQALTLIITFCSISVLFIFLIYSQNLIFGSTAGEWLYPYFSHIDSIPPWIPISVIFLSGILVYAGSRTIERYEVAALVGCFVISVVIQIFIQNIYPIHMDRLISSDVTNSFYSTSLQFSPIEILSNFDKIAPSLPMHSRTNMPGKILFFQLLSVFTSSNQIMGYIIITISSLGGLLLYGICRYLFQDKVIALYSLILYALIPCKQEFFPILNTVTPIFILLSLYLLLAYLDSKSKLYLIFLGISLYILVIFEPSPLVMGIVFIGVLLQAIGRKKIVPKELFPIVAIPVFSFITIYLLFLLFFSFDLWRTLNYVIKNAMEFNANNHRSYLVWVRENVKEFFYGAGLPTVMVFIYLLIEMLSQLKVKLTDILHWSVENAFVLSLITTFCVVLFLGINRGETTRLWIYLAAFFQIPAAYFLAKVVKNQTVFLIFAGTLIMQSIITLQRVKFLNP